MIIYGKNAINEALNANKNIEKAYIINNKDECAGKDIVAKLKAKKIPIQYVDKKRLDIMCESENHRGFAVSVSEFVYSSVEDILSVSEKNKKSPFIVILDELNDPHNFGSIIRSCECAGVDGIIIPARRSVGVTDTVIRISQGATEYVKIAKVTNINNTITELKKKNIFVFACESGGQSIYKTNLTGAVALVIGSEGEGVRSLTKSLCDGIIALPLFGKINSLNASNACAIALYEALRQREGKL